MSNGFGVCHFCQYPLTNSEGVHICANSIQSTAYIAGGDPSILEAKDYTIEKLKETIKNQSIRIKEYIYDYNAQLDEKQVEIATLRAKLAIAMGALHAIEAYGTIESKIQTGFATAAIASIDKESK